MVQQKSVKVFNRISGFQDIAYITKTFACPFHIFVVSLFYVCFSCNKALQDIISALKHLYCSLHSSCRETVFIKNFSTRKVGDGSTIRRQHIPDRMNMKHIFRECGKGSSRCHNDMHPLLCSRLQCHTCSFADPLRRIQCCSIQIQSNQLDTHFSSPFTTSRNSVLICRTFFIVQPSPCPGYMKISFGHVLILSRMLRSI